MRFTKIPLIATLMAVALSLLIVLPTLAQVSGDRTDGRLSVGQWVDVRVADNLANVDSTDTDNRIGAAFLATGFNAQDTYFNGDLYISNQTSAFNTILISAAILVTDEADRNSATPLVEGKPCDEGVRAAEATIKNNRSGTSVKAYLIPTTTTDAANASKTIYQGIAAVWDQEDSIEEHNGPCGASPDHGDPVKWYPFGTDADEVGDTDSASESDGVFIDTTETDTSDDREDGWTATSAAIIPARDGDTLTVTVKGVAGSINLIVDGEAPEIFDAVPASGGVTKDNTVNVGFTVSDDGSGLRYDGESGASTDTDLQPHNGDGDQRFDEPITVDPEETGDQVQHNGDGSTMDIKVRFSNTAPAEVELLDSDDMSELGSNDWTQRSKGAEYALDMRVVGQPFGTYYWQVTAKDRVGNKATTDSDDEKKGNQPFSFNVDDADPEASSARTGIGYEDGEGEFKDRSWIALNFENEANPDQPQVGGEDRIDASTVAPGDFTVGGHTVMNVVVPDDKGVCKGDIVRSGPYTGIVSQAPDSSLTPAVTTAVTEADYHLGTEEDESAKNITAFDADDKVGSDLVTPVSDTETNDGTNTFVRGMAEVKTASMCDFEPRARIYLELEDELASDETPTIQMLGGAFKDNAGNNNVTQSIKAVDKIAPGVSISITSSTGTTGRAATDDDGSFTVRVSSDEDLGKFPRLFFATIKADEITSKGVATGVGTDTSLRIDAVTGGDGISLTEKETNTWEKKINADSGDIPGSGDRIVAAVVTATDENGNSGNSAGWKGSGKPAGDHKLDFKKLDAGGFLLEIDNRMVPAEIEVLPSTDPGKVTDETESSNPYIQITFSEPDEYGIALDGECTDKDDDSDTGVDDNTADCAEKADIGGGDSSRTDSHRAVEVTALTLNGESMLAELVDVEPWKYVLAVTGLEVGEYEIVYSARDDVGNDVEDEDFTFKVLERQPYEIELQPGWNLISVPGDPFNPAVGSVIGSDLKADTVLGYQSGEWVTSVRNEDGRWQGTLTDIQGGYGYWVRTTVVETIETVIPPTLPTSVLPTVPIISGWNLVGVVDAAQRSPGEDVGEDADEYLTSLKGQWRVAYSFHTQLNQWEKLLPNPGEENLMLNGKGYWLWNTKPATLVP